MATNVKAVKGAVRRGVIAPIATAVAIAGVAALVAPVGIAVVAPLLFITGCIGLGARRLHRLHRHLEATDFTGIAGHGFDTWDTDDEAEMSTFAALQRADEHLELAGLLLDASTPRELVELHHRLTGRFEDFVFSGTGIGDLAAAWALEQDCSALADEALSDRRRPAA